MKKVMVTMALLLSGLAAQAQEGLSLGGHVALPVGDAADFSGFSIGIDAVYLWGVADSFDAGAATGLTNAFGKSEDFGSGVTVDYDDVQFLPLAAAGRFHASDQFILGVDLGYAIGLNDGNDGGFYYRPQVGYALSDLLQLTLSYTGISLDGGTWSTIGLGILYRL